MKFTAKILLPVLLLVFLSLLGAIWTGWSRIGWLLPMPTAGLALYHGPLMTMSFLGALIALERTVALRQKWMFIAPISLGMAGLLLIAGQSSQIARLLLLLGSVAFVLIQFQVLRMHKALYTWILLAASLMGLLGNILWLIGLPIHRVVWWWAIFLIFTISGERLELGRLLRLTVAARISLIICGLLLMVGAAAVTILHEIGSLLAGLGLVGFGFWFLRFDIARRTIRQKGPARLPVTRFIALSLLVGFIWLVVCGLLVLFYGFAASGLTYDAILHALFIGFVFSMIFGHAPIILPSLFGMQFTYNNLLYLPLLLLHLSLTVRIFGDLNRLVSLRLWGGLLNGVAILLFMGLMLPTIIHTRITRQRNYENISDH